MYFINTKLRDFSKKVFFWFAYFFKLSNKSSFNICIRLFLLTLLQFSMLGILSCGPEKNKNNPIKITKAKSDSLMAEMEKAYNKMEEDRILNYISMHHSMKKSEKGFWYYISKEQQKGKQINESSIVKYSRKISLCNGTLCYSDIISLKVGNGNEITGMHDALPLFKQGEIVTLIFPSYMAQGLMGDNNKIPPKSELIYTVEILDVK